MRSVVRIEDEKLKIRKLNKQSPSVEQSYADGSVYLGSLYTHRAALQHDGYQLMLSFSVGFTLHRLESCTMLHI